MLLDSIRALWGRPALYLMNRASRYIDRRYRSIQRTAYVAVLVRFCRGSSARIAQCLDVCVCRYCKTSTSSQGSVESLLFNNLLTRMWERVVWPQSSVLPSPPS